MKSFCAAIALLAITYMPMTAFAWGGRGHAVIDRTAVDAIPADGPLFLKKYVDYIAASASVPDWWRAASEPFSKIDEDPNHGWLSRAVRIHESDSSFPV
jgi:hypothetical protein